MKARTYFGCHILQDVLLNIWMCEADTEQPTLDLAHGPNLLMQTSRSQPDPPTTRVWCSVRDIIMGWIKQRIIDVLLPIRRKVVGNSLLKGPQELCLISSQFSNCCIWKWVILPYLLTKTQLSALWKECNIVNWEEIIKPQVLDSFSLRFYIQCTQDHPMAF